MKTSIFNFINLNNNYRKSIYEEADDEDSHIIEDNYQIKLDSTKTNNYSNYKSKEIDYQKQSGLLPGLGDVFEPMNNNNLLFLNDTQIISSTNNNIFDLIGINTNVPISTNSNDGTNTIMNKNPNNIFIENDIFSQITSLNTANEHNYKEIYTNNGISIHINTTNKENNNIVHTEFYISNNSSLPLTDVKFSVLSVKYVSVQVIRSEGNYLAPNQLYGIKKVNLYFY